MPPWSAFFWIEVFPEALPDLQTVIGEWSAFDLDEAALVNRARTGRMPWVRRYLYGSMVKSEWYAVPEVTRWMHRLDGDQRMQLAHALDVCGFRYFEEPDKPLFGVIQENVDKLREVMAEVWPRYEPLSRSMLAENKASFHDARAAAVRRLIDGQEKLRFRHDICVE